VLFPSRIRVIPHEFATRDEYRNWLIEGSEPFRNSFNGDSRAEKHTSSPFTWFEGTSSSTFLGGCDDTLAWCRKFASPASNASGESAIMKPDGHVEGNSYDYDLIVIGGGSGGLAASKESAKLGARVAVLDFVKPSPKGTDWGLGGTCVNVGCIPKKLMHNAANINEIMIADTAAFGISAYEKTSHNWEEMRSYVQNHIRGLNFKYRVNLRENNVTYFNKLGKFLDPHTIEVVDKRGEVSTMTASRFLIAVGGRPSPLDCEGGDLAISSDDVFALEKSPGKTLCVGASYISLECAGFLAGLGYDTTVAVRSILLRGFDRECADKIESYMQDHGVNFKYFVVPKKLEKVAGDKIRVTFSDESQDEYDTVLVAIGRSADTSNLGLNSVGIATGKNGKIPTVYEQTSCSNVYAIGDVMEGCPELTPVAIQAGLSLARRLFGGSSEAMDYQNVCTTVFTPLEYGTVGLSEEDAIEKFETENIEIYHKSFVPLEWSISEKRSHHDGFCKVICDKSDNMRVVGIHYLGPNAGEVMQGFGVAMKKSFTFKDLEDTVGIHPTTAEEIVTLSITKSSGEDAAAGGC